MNRIDFFAFRASPAAALCRQLGIDIGPCETWNDFTATLVSRNSTTDGGVVAASMGSPPPASVPCCMPSCMPAISTGWPTNSPQARPGTDCRVSPVPTHWPQPPASPGSADSPSRKPEQALLVSEPAHAMSQTAADRVLTPLPSPPLATKHGSRSQFTFCSRSANMPPCAAPPPAENPTRSICHGL